jgi:hypothetical protein
MDADRERELKFLIAAEDGNVDDMTRYLDEGVDIECHATDMELQEYRRNSASTDSNMPATDTPNRHGRDSE